MRSLVGASVPLWVTQLFHNLGFQWAGLLLALFSCVILVSAPINSRSPSSQPADAMFCSLQPIPFLFFKFGRQIRQRSTRAERDG